MSSRPQTKKPIKGEYLETDSGNLISRRAKLLGTTHIILHGRVAIQPSAVLRGDLVRPASTAPDSIDRARTAITIGRYSYVSSHAVLHPPFLIARDASMNYVPMTLGSNVFVGEGAYVAAASVGNNVFIGDGAVVGNACVIGDRVKVVEGSVLVAGMAVPSGVVVGGRPARILDEIPDGWGHVYGGVDDGEWVEGGDLRELIRSVNK